MVTDELLRRVTERLTATGVPSPRVDAELLVAHALGITRSELLARARDEIDATVVEPVVVRREAREPLQHILGQAPFRHLMLDIGPGAFIPRPETELLVEKALPVLAAIASPLLVDLCSGSGAIAAAVAHEAPHARVIAVEREPDALPWLRRNAEPLGVEVIAGDATDAGLLAERRGTVDVVLANPPYVPAAAIVDVEVRADPAAAVFGGEDGLALIPHVIARAAEWLRTGGLFAMEHEASQGRVVPELLRLHDGGGRFTDITDHRDLAGRPRYVTAIRA